MTLIRMAARFALICGLLAVSPAIGANLGDQHPRVMISGPYNALGFCQLASLASSTGLATCAGGIPAGATLVEICIGGNGVSYRDDGTAPTAAIGMNVSAGTCFAYAGPLAAIAFIQAGAGAIVNASFYQ